VTEVLLLEEVIRANLASRTAVRPAVERQHIEPAWPETPNDAGGAPPVVRDTMQIDERGTP